jgi:hypothetical protein
MFSSAETFCFWVKLPPVGQDCAMLVGKSTLKLVSQPKHSPIRPLWSAAFHACGSGLGH